MDSRDPLFGQSDSSAALPIAVCLSGISPSSAAPARPPQPQPHSADEFHLLEHSGQPLYELQPLRGPGAQMVSVSEMGRVLCSCTFEELFYVVLVCCSNSWFKLFLLVTR